MTYEECLDIMFHSLPMYQRQGKAAYKADLNRTLEIDAFFKHPHRHYKTIHIAGTNGKGSVSHMLASILQEAGYKTGLYTSPHLKDYRERIRVDGEMIAKDYVLDFMEKHLDRFKELSASFFEMSVALAFEYFRDQDVDIAVIETGMGGRLDSTNIVSPELSVITNIGFDHTAFLGDNLPAIAGEKAGIIKPGIPVVSGSDNPDINQVFEKKASLVKSDLVLAQDRCKLLEYQIGTEMLSAKYKVGERVISLDTDMTGLYQLENLKTVLTAFDILKSEFDLDYEDMYHGLAKVKANTKLQGRWQKLGDSPRIYCDVAHNAEGLTFVLEQITRQKYKSLYFVLGVVNDKNLDKILPLFPQNARYIFTEAAIPRALPAQELFKEARKFNLKGKVVVPVEAALSVAKSESSGDDLIFVGGSTFTVAEIL